MKKRLFALMVAVVLIITTLAGCTGGTVDPSGPDKVEFESITIGVYAMEWNSYNYVGWKNWLEYIGEEMNIKFLYSTEAADAEGEKTFLERMGAAGADGVICGPCFNIANCLDVCSQYEMFYSGGGDHSAAIAELPEELTQWLVSSRSDPASIRMENGYQVGLSALSKLDKSQPITVKLITLNPNSGIPLIAPPFLQRDGIMKAVEELRAEGYEINVEEFYPTGPTPNDWAAATENALANLGDAENAALISSTQLNYSLQTFVNSGRAGKVVFAGFGGATPDLVPYFEDGTVSVVGDEGVPGSAVARSFPVMYNAITGHPFTSDYRVYSGDDTLVIDTYDKLIDLLEHQPDGEYGPYFTYEVISKLIYVVNPDVTFEDYIEFVEWDPSGYKNAD